MRRPVLIASVAVVLAALAGGACQKPVPVPAAGPDDAVLDDPERPGLTFARAPVVVTLDGLFEVWLRINDQRGLRVGDDSSTVVTISASGQGGLPDALHGTLHGTLSRRVTGGLVIFDDLRYDAWEPITLTARTDESGGRAGLGTERLVPVQPLLRFVEPPAARLPVGDSVGPFDIELVDGRGRRLPTTQPVTLTSSNPQLVPPEEQEHPLDAGQVHFGAIALPAAGDVKLTFKAPGAQDLVHVVSAREGAIVTSMWLPGARVGVPYATRLDLGAGVELGADLPSGVLPRGLYIDDLLQLRGVPSSAGFASFDIFAGESPVAPHLVRFRLPVLPSVETPAEPLDGLDRPGPFAVETLDEVLDVPVRGVSEGLRLFYPRGTEPGKKLPLIIFHHGAAPVSDDHPTLFDRFDHFLRRWASHGFVVASIDAVDLAWKQGRLVGASLANLNAMAENQRAAFTHMRAVDVRAGHPLAGLVDIDRVILAGHSRGAGAALIAAAGSPAVIGGILLQPLDPLVTAGGEQLWNTRLPAKPFLVIAAGNDGDLPYPMVDFLYERRAAPMALVTVRGATHFSACDDSCKDEPGATATIGRPQEWSVANAYALAFLRYVAEGELGYAPLLFGGAGLASNLAPQGIFRSSDASMDAVMVDDFQGETTGRNRLGQAASERNLDWSGNEPSILQAASQLPDSYAIYRLLYHHPQNEAWSGAHRLRWSRPDAAYLTELGGLDVRGRAAFTFRARTDGDVLPPGALGVRFVDGSDHQLVVPVQGTAGVGPRYTDVIVPLPAAGALDLSSLTRVELLLGGSGSMLIDDLRFE
jgi:dienelactone hydrolase